MSDAIVVALITGAVSLIGSLVSMLVSAQKAKQTSALTLYRIDQLEQKVNKHNNLIDRMYKREQHDEVTDEQIKVANYRIDNLEAFMNKINNGNGDEK